MKRHISAVLVLASFCGVCAAIPPPGKTVYIVKIMDFDKKESYQAMTEAEFKALQAEIQNEAGLFVRALDNAKRSWESGGGGARQTFPGRSAIAPRDASIVGQPWTDAEKAQRKVEQLAGEESRREKEKAERRTAHDTKRVAGLTKKDDKGAQTKLLARAKARQQEQEDSEAQAVALFRGELDKLKAQIQEPGKKEAPPVQQ